MMVKNECNLAGFDAESCIEMDAESSSLSLLTQEIGEGALAGILIGSFLAANITPVLFVIDRCTKHSEAYYRAVELTNSVNQTYSDETTLFLKRCKYLREITDKKLYRIMGFKDFKLFCRTMLPFGVRQAYRHINVVKRFPDEYVTSMSQAPTKVILLCTLSDDQLKQIESKLDLNVVSCAVLRKAIAKLKKEEKQTSKKKEKQNQKLENENKMLQAKCESYRQSTEAWRSCSLKQNDKNVKLSHRVKSNQDSVISDSAATKASKMQREYAHNVTPQTNIPSQKETTKTLVTIGNGNEDIYRDYVDMFDGLINDFKIWCQDMPAEEREEYLTRIKEELIGKIEQL